MTSSTQGNGGSNKTKPTLDRDVVEASSEQDYDALNRMLEEKRRAFTIMRAEAEKERELREALQAQLLDANAEIVASWDRRKEMARVIGDQQAQLSKHNQTIADLEQLVANSHHAIAGLEQLVAKSDAAVAKLKEVVANREQAIAGLEQLVAKSDAAVAKLKEVVANREQAIAKRDKVLADRQKVIANRDQKISELKDQLRARYEELAVLEQHIVQSTLSGKAKRLVRQARQMARKSFQAP